MSDWTSNEAREFLSIIRGEAEKVVKDFGDRQSSIYACLAVVINVTAFGDTSVRLLSSPSDGSQDFVVRNRSGSMLKVGDSVWLHYWGDYTNVYIAMRNSGGDILALPYDAVSSNLLINGGFDVWQRGTSQTGTGYGSDDRWKNNHGGATNKTHSRQAFTIGQTDVPGNPKYYSRTTFVSGGTPSSSCTKQQYIEDVSLLGGKELTLSFYAAADVAKYLSVEVVKYYGSGGSPVESGLCVHKILIGTTMDKYEVTLFVPSNLGKVIGPGSYLAIVFWFDAGSDYNARTASLGNQSGTFDIANVQLNYGSVALPFVPRSFADELRLCQRYVLIADASNAFIARMVFYTTNTVVFFIPTPVTMRSNPTLIGTVGTQIQVVGLTGAPSSGFAFGFVVCPSGILVTATKTSHGLTDASLTFNVNGGLDAEL